jgi:choline dehydrogenase-like flavoprotein
VIRQLPDLDQHATLRTDVVVVGAGIAGIEIARMLGAHGVATVLLESGRLEFDGAIQELARVRCTGTPLRHADTHAHLSTFLPPMYRGYSRIRQFGGTSNVWTGKWRIFDPWDFEKRDWIPHSGWPITIGDLLPYQRATARDYQLGDFEAEAGREFHGTTGRRLAPYGIEPHLFYWEKSPTRSGARFFGELKAAAHVDVLLGATATELLLHDDLQTVGGVRCRSLASLSIVIEADRVVLATGGLETPRLLLASDRQVPGGIGNANGLVGRFFMDHPKNMGGVLHPGRAVRRLLPGLETQPRPRFGVSLSLSLAEQRERRLPNHALFLKPVRYLGRGPLRHFEVKFALEQIPNPESRVFLGSRIDSLGMPELVVDWKFTDQDRAALAALQLRLTSALAAAGVGRLDFGSRPLTMDDMMDASHHMGTTRMAANATDGVVDADCRVFGTTNLYIASSAVFPTGHSYSPTFTILALARRLAEHLRSRRTLAARLDGAAT